ncbi:T9SS type A sorting domain-containing protein [Flavobacterium sp.]|uniref:T9SS type A sorting domain-containing protein n=2 Tax=Flavobacterium sp. TaxID=239 RepID=UPI0040482DF7
MKYLYIIFCVLFSCFSFSQDYNNNWVLANSKISFDTNPATSSAISNANKYGFASVSDPSGNLLFYTDGVKVYDKTFGMMQNGYLTYGINLFDERRVQPVIIVPHPGNDKQYYVFVSDVQDTLCGSCSSLTQYSYFIVDFQDPTYPNGKVIEPSTGSSLFTNTGYFGPLTLVKNASNDGYFVILHTNPSQTNGGGLHSYKIDSNGINLTPILTNLPNNINYYNFSDAGEFRSNTKAIMRFGMNNTKFGELLITNSFHQGPNTNTNLSSFFTMDFNNVTGTFSNFQMIQSNSSSAYKDFEFSNDSEKVYFVNNNVFVRDLANLSLPDRKLAANNSPSIFPSALHIQRDKNNDIIVSNKNSNILYKLDNVNSYNASSIITNYLSLNSVLTDHYLPQFIPSLSDSCLSDVVLTINVSSGSEFVQSSNYITAKNVINSSAIAIYHANERVILANGFHAKSGAIFKAYIEGCTGVFQSKNSDQKDETNNVRNNINDLVKLYPNPNNGNFVIEIGDHNFKNGTIEVFDSHGKIIYQNNYLSKEMNISLENIGKGVYFVKLISNDGNIVFDQKFIKH